MHNIPINNIAAMERWYFNDHAGEIVRRYGPWLTRHESFLPVMAPADAQAYGFFNWRVTDGWWRELPLLGPTGTFAYTWAPCLPKVATCFIPPQPTEDFLGSEIKPDEKQVLRWFIMLKYPEGVSKKDGEDWFLNVHSKEVMKQPGLYRYFSYKTIQDDDIALPGWGKTNPPDCDNKWDRVVEMWYETFDDWRKSVIQNPPKYTKPKWGKYDKYPYLEPGVNFVSTFILERPSDEFGRDSRRYR